MGSSSFQEGFLRAHNTLRAKHGCPPLQLNSELSRKAQGWAENLINTDSFDHMSKNSDGENLFYKESSEPGVDVSPEEAVKSWYSEISQFNFSKEPDPRNFTAGHFTQVIWKGTTDLGGGIAVSRNGKKAIVVGEYRPMGNMIGSFRTNVPPPK